MRVSRAAAFWIGVGLACLVALALLRQIMLPFAVGAIGAYLLVPLIDRLEALGINRSLAALSVVFVLASSLIIVAVLAFPVVAGEVRHFVDQFPNDVVRLQAIAVEAGGPWVKSVLGQDRTGGASSADLVSKLGGEWLDEALHSMWAGGLAVLSLFSLAVVAPIITIYMIIDWKRMILAVDGWLSPAWRADIHALVGEIHLTLSAFLRGQTLICCVLALVYVLALSAIGLRHAVVLGLVAGLISFVPYLGAATGLALSTLVAIVQFWPDWLPTILVVATFVIGEAIADYVLSPRIIGKRVKLNPLWLIFALSAFGWLFGFVGLMIAVPAAASIGVVLRYAMARARIGNGQG